MVWQEKELPFWFAPEPNKSTKLKTPSSRNTRAINLAPVKTKSRKVKPRQSGLFKRFTLLVVGYTRERFVWARRKSDTTNADHHKRVAEHYIFDEVLGRQVPRDEYEKRAKFNSINYKPTQDESTRFPSHPKQDQSERDHSIDLTPSIPLEQVRKNSYPRLRPPKLGGDS